MGEIIRHNIVNPKVLFLLRYSTSSTYHVLSYEVSLDTQHGTKLGNTQGFVLTGFNKLLNTVMVLLVVRTVTVYLCNMKLGKHNYICSYRVVLHGP